MSLTRDPGAPEGSLILEQEKTKYYDNIRKRPLNLSSSFIVHLQLPKEIDPAIFHSTF
jgi:hypothetical protein